MTQHHNGQGMSDTQGNGWSGLADSLLRLITASTVFGIQQTQNSFDLLVDSRKAIKEFRRSVDALTDAMMGQVDTSKDSLAGQVKDTGERIINSTRKIADELQPEEALSGRKE